jgi:alpha-L-fucosidase 2
MPHLSQLWGAYPGSQITSSNTSTFAWAISSLNRRLQNGSGGWGWTRAWATCLAARFFNPSLVHQGLVLLASTYRTPDTMLSSNSPSAFQIDGSLGGPAGMLEALLQSHEFVSGSSLAAAQIGDSSKSTLIRLLPALPSQWTGNGAGGSVKGLRARGGWQVDISWDGSGSLKSATLTSLSQTPAWVTLGSTVIGAGGGTSIKVNGGSGSTFVQIASPSAGAVYTVTLA